MTKRLNITLSDEVLARADVYAREHRYTRSGLIAEAIDAFVGGRGAEVARETVAAYRTPSTNASEAPTLAQIEPLLRAFFTGADDVEAAWVFGSVARGQAGPLSDVDIAVLFSRSLDRTARADRSYILAVRLSEVIRMERVDVVSIADAPPLLGARVARDGVRVYAPDAHQAAEAELRATTRALDFEPAVRKRRARLTERLGGK